MRTNDDYIKANDPVRNTSAPQGGDAAMHLTPDQVLDAAVALEGMDWSEGLTRDQILRAHRDFPVGLYLRLPDSKRFMSANEVLREAGVSRSRAEGEYLGANPDIPTAESVSDGGPPDWGNQPSVYSPGATIDGGSAEDTEGLLPGDNPELGEVPGT